VADAGASKKRSAGSAHQGGRDGNTTSSASRRAPTDIVGDEHDLGAVVVGCWSLLNRGVEADQVGSRLVEGNTSSSEAGAHAMAARCSPPESSRAGVRAARQAGGAALFRQSRSNAARRAMRHG
jgi:hypothetical protein